MSNTLGWGYKVRALVRRAFPRVIGVRRFFRNRCLERKNEGFGKELAEAIRGKFFYGQHGEDKEVYEAFFSNNRVAKGFFVELGALDGIQYSNSKFFEDYLGWRGLLIEPVPEQFEKLKWNRPADILVCAAVSESEGDIEFWGESATAGMSHTMAESFKKDWHAQGVRSFLVKGGPFWKILQQHHVRSIDFLSIDVEGGEREVLNTFDWDIPVHVIAIELDGYNESKDRACRQLLTARGFLMHKKVEMTEIWYQPAFPVNPV